MILLVHEHDGSGTVALASKYIIGEHVPERLYSKEGSYLALDGPPHIIEHDAEEICKIPGWRLATPEEQNAYTKGQKKAGKVQEVKGEASKEEEPPQKPSAGTYESLR